MRVRAQTTGPATELGPDAWADQVINGFAEHIREQAAFWDSVDEPAPSAGEILGLLASVLPTPTPNALDTELGPFYDTNSVRTLLGGVTKQAIENRRNNHTILAMKTSDGRWVYPVSQFLNRDVNPALIPAVQAFGNSPGWSTALWFVTEHPDLDDKTPSDWLTEHSGPHDIGWVATLAARTAHAWQ